MNLNLNHTEMPQDQKIKLLLDEIDRKNHYIKSCAEGFSHVNTAHLQQVQSLIKNLDLDKVFLKQQYCDLLRALTHKESINQHLDRVRKLLDSHQQHTHLRSKSSNLESPQQIHSTHQSRISSDQLFQQIMGFIQSLQTQMAQSGNRMPSIQHQMKALQDILVIKTQEFQAHQRAQFPPTILTPVSFSPINSLQPLPIKSLSLSPIREFVPHGWQSLKQVRMVTNVEPTFPQSPRQIRMVSSVEPPFQGHNLVKFNRPLIDQRQQSQQSELSQKKQFQKAKNSKIDLPVKTHPHTNNIRDPISRFQTADPKFHSVQKSSQTQILDLSGFNQIIPQAKAKNQNDHHILQAKIQEIDHIIPQAKVQDTDQLIKFNKQTKLSQTNSNKSNEEVLKQIQKTNILQQVKIQIIQSSIQCQTDDTQDEINNINFKNQLLLKQNKNLNDQVDKMYSELLSLSQKNIKIQQDFTSDKNVISTTLDAKVQAMSTSIQSLIKQNSELQNEIIQTRKQSKQNQFKFEGIGSQCEDYQIQEMNTPIQGQLSCLPTTNSRFFHDQNSLQSPMEAINNESLIQKTEILTIRNHNELLTNQVKQLQQEIQNFTHQNTQKNRSPIPRELKYDQEDSLHKITQRIQNFTDQSLTQADQADQNQFFSQKKEQKKLRLLVDQDFLKSSDKKQSDHLGSADIRLLTKKKSQVTFQDVVLSEQEEELKRLRSSKKKLSKQNSLTVQDNEELLGQIQQKNNFINDLTVTYYKPKIKPYGAQQLLDEHSETQQDSIASERESNQAKFSKSLQTSDTNKDDYANVIKNEASTMKPTTHVIGEWNKKVPNQQIHQQTITQFSDKSNQDLSLLPPYEPCMLSNQKIKDYFKEENPHANYTDNNFLEQSLSTKDYRDEQLLKQALEENLRDLILRFEQELNEIIEVVLDQIRLVHDKVKENIAAMPEGSGKTQVQSFGRQIYNSLGDISIYVNKKRSEKIKHIDLQIGDDKIQYEKIIKQLKQEINILANYPQTDEPGQTLVLKALNKQQFQIIEDLKIEIVDLQLEKNKQQLRPDQETNKKLKKTIDQ